MASNNRIDVQKLSEIVVEMLAQNISESDILIHLQQNNLDEKTAIEILEKAKTYFEQTLGDKLDSLIEKKVTERSTSKFGEIRKELELKQDLRISEQKEYTDRKVMEEKSEIDSLKSEIVSIKLKEDADLKKMQEKIDLVITSNPKQKLLGVGLLTAGLFTMVAVLYFSYMVLLNYIINKTQIDFPLLLYVLIIILLGIVSSIAVTNGYKIYSIGEKKFEKAAIEFMNSKKTKEEDSLQNLVNDEEVF